jgi:transmembrane sensor
MDLDAIDIQTLIIADLLGSITADEKIQLNKLLSEHESVRAQYESIQQELASEGTSLTTEGYATADQLIAIAGKRKRTKMIRFFGVAASLILILGGGLLYYITYPQQYSKSILLGDNNIITQTVLPGNTPKELLLSDGTTIILAAGSTLEYPKTFRGDKREITITGEAYMKIARSTTPFTVNTGKGLIEVLGTEFNVNTYDSDPVKVALIEGSVRINTDGHSQLLKAGEMASFSGKDITVNSFNKDAVLGWQAGIFSFPAGVTLDEIAKVVSRNSNIKLIVEPSASGEIYSGVVYDRSMPISDLLNVLTKTHSIVQVTTPDGAIHLK